ncbi:MAG: tetratricopeptide repeat protein [Bacteroidales bacterium]|nr:tetratricopeptide repeat protein [Bacteroidales bacterium]
MRKFLIFISLFLSVAAFAQVDKKDVRRGNRQFGKARYGDADISYRKALNADSTSVPAAYDLANNLYRQGDFAGAGKSYQQALRHIPETKPRKQADYAFDTYFNAGDAALQQKQYRAAMESFIQALLIRPDDMEAKENYVYARKMLENNPDGGGGGNDQNQDQNQDQNKDQQDQNQDQQNQDQQNQDQNQDQQDQDQQQKPYNGETGISPQQAQQMLQAIQAKEKETQDKVNKEKAAVLKSRQKEKNW